MISVSSVFRSKHRYLSALTLFSFMPPLFVWQRWICILLLCASSLTCVFMCRSSRNTHSSAAQRSWLPLIGANWSLMTVRSGVAALLSASLFLSLTHTYKHKLKFFIQASSPIVWRRTVSTNAANTLTKAGICTEVSGAFGLWYFSTSPLKTGVCWFVSLQTN